MAQHGKSCLLQTHTILASKLSIFTLQTEQRVRTTSNIIKLQHKLWLYPSLPDLWDIGILNLKHRLHAVNICFSCHKFKVDVTLWGSWMFEAILMIHGFNFSRVFCFRVLPFQNSVDCRYSFKKACSCVFRHRLRSVFGLSFSTLTKVCRVGSFLVFAWSEQNKGPGI